MTEKKPLRFAPQPGQKIPIFQLDADPDNAFWLKHWHPEARYAPDSPQGVAWSLENGWTAETWATSAKRAQWQTEWDERQAVQTQQEGTKANGREEAATAT